MTFSTGKRISNVHIVLISMSAIGILDHVIIIPILLKISGRDAWLSVLTSGLLLFLWLPMLYFIIKRTKQQNLFLWVKSKYGVLLSSFIRSSFFINFLFISTMTTKDVTDWADMSYLPETPKVILIASILLVSCYVAYSGIRTLAIVNGILLPFIVLFGFYVAISNSSKKDYTLLFPVFEHGMQPYLHGVIYGCGGFMELIFILSFQHLIRTKIRRLTLIITAFILINLTLSPLTGAIAEFGPIEAASMRFPAFEEWRLVSFSHYIEHTDFLSIYQWLSGSLIRLSLALCLQAEALNITTPFKRMICIIATTVFILIFGILPISDITFIQLLLQSLPYFLLFNLGISLLLFVLVLVKKEKVTM
ncbi:hypothetical protein GCM10011391_18830 [Pullulanibacillus camelliae]|uniref:Uncharacterized protein n=1 Tax=Pullulanibacillus camelliae TaxID=1707096 RepID=A0A8J2VNM2_9BACL|nr:endospore germination permease [Pullulanibacillus camelliae]GGE40282.1 hypothetical protein GCM10011391_18830 [Pullulanibacillus camelliae]